MSIEATIEKLTWLNGQIWAKRSWLETHTKNWPAHDVEVKKSDLAMLETLQSDYQKVKRRYEECADHQQQPNATSQSQRL